MGHPNLSRAAMLVMLSLVTSQAPAAVITQWDFTNGSTNPSIGAGRLSAIAVKAVPVDNNSALNTQYYPPQSSGNKSAGLEFAVSTAGNQNILITWDERLSPDASKYGRLQYATDATNFVD